MVGEGSILDHRTQKAGHELKHSPVNYPMDHCYLQLMSM